MNQPWVYMCSPSWDPLPPPSLSHPSGSSQYGCWCSDPALSTLTHTLNLDWWSISHMIIYMFQCYSLICFLLFQYLKKQTDSYALIYAHVLFSTLWLQDYKSHWTEYFEVYKNGWKPIVPIACNTGWDKHLERGQIGGAHHFPCGPNMPRIIHKCTYFLEDRPKTLFLLY